MYYLGGMLLVNRLEGQESINHNMSIRYDIIGGYKVDIQLMITTNCNNGWYAQ